MPTKYDPVEYQAHKAGYAARQKRYYDRHPGIKAEISKRYRDANKEQGNAHIREYYRQDPKRKFAVHIKNRYGLTLEVYNAMKVQQGDACALCGAVKPLHVDHDHATGRVRGLLCAGCNGGLGHYEKPGWPQKADAYLGRDYGRVIAELTEALKTAKGRAV